MKRKNKEPEPESAGGDAASEIMTLHGVADYLKVHYTTVYRFIKSHDLPAFRLGGDFRSCVPTWRSGSRNGMCRESNAHNEP